MAITPPRNLKTASFALLSMVRSGLLDEIANAPADKLRALEGQLEMILAELRERHRRGEHG